MPPYALLVATALCLGAAATATAGAQSSVAPPPAFDDPDRLGTLARTIPAVDSVMRTFMERTRAPGLYVWVWPAETPVVEAA